MDTEKIKRYSLAELTLLIIFIIGLLLAWLVVKSRSSIVLTDPIALEGSGLSVRLPGGAAWEYTPGWTYTNDDSMVLAAQRRLASDAAIKITWQFNFCSRPADLADVLKERLAQSNAAVKLLDMPEGTRMQAAQVTISQGVYNDGYLVARRNLDFGRAIELQVIPSHPAIDPFYLEALLRETASSVVYEAPAEIAAGTDLLNRFFNTLNADSVRDEAFLITDRRGRTTGFFYADKQATDGNEVVIIGRHYDAQQFRIDSWLKIGRLADPFEVTTSVRLPGSPVQGYQIRRQEGGGLRVSGAINGEKDIACAEIHLLPEILLSDYVQLFLASDYDRVIADVVSGTGMVVPVLIERISTEEASARSEEVASAVRVSYLHGKGFFDEMYYNKDTELIGRFERQPRRQDRLWDKSSSSELRHVFGELLDVQ